MVRFGERRVGKGRDFLHPNEREVCGRTRHLLQHRLLGVAARPSSYLRCIGNCRSIEGGKIPTAVDLTKVDPREPPLASRPSALDWSCRGLLAPSIGSCRARWLIYWDRTCADSGLGPRMWPHFALPPEPKKHADSVLGSILGSQVELL
jgi:hypothetical protein